MTKLETSEIFSLMMIAWPNAEMFRGGLSKLDVTITLWHRCLGGTDRWIGQCVAYELCKTNKFPPTIAEFLEKCTELTQFHTYEVYRLLNQVKRGSYMYEDLQEFVNTLPTSSLLSQLIFAMGGASNLVKPAGDKQRWNLEAFEMAYWQTIKKTAPQLTAGTRAIEGGQK
ncbi:replicative helicase loader/inhibitor [Bengtsoniella intestinalis]|uniref:hypothetical protein n=1 Tax=Bengtsoniella intestinalis TaxID=3073143 RepID=UPI00391F51FC